MYRFLKKDYLIILFFLIIYLSILDNQLIIINNNFLNKIGLNNISIKWVSFFLTIIFGLYIILKKKDKYFFTNQRYIILFFIYIFLFSLINFIQKPIEILNNFEKIKIIFNLNKNLSIYLFIFSKLVYWISLILIFFILYTVLAKYPKNKIENYLIFFFCIFILLNLLYEIIVQSDILSIKKTLLTYNKDPNYNKFIGKTLIIKNNTYVFENISHHRFIGTFREPSYLGFYCSLIFFVNFSKQINIRFIFILRFISALLLFATVSVKIIFFFPFMIAYLLFILEEKKKIIIYYFLPLIAALIFDIFFFDHIKYLFFKLIYYLMAFFPDLLNFINKLNFGKPLIIILENTDIIDKAATSTIYKQEITKYISMINLLFGLSFFPKYVEQFYILFLGKGALIDTFYVSGIFILLLVYQFYKNVLIVDKVNIYKNLILLFYMLYYFYFVKDTFQIDLVLIYIIMYVNSKNKFKYFK